MKRAAARLGGGVGGGHTGGGARVELARSCEEAAARIVLGGSEGVARACEEEAVGVGDGRRPGQRQEPKLSDVDAPQVGQLHRQALGEQLVGEREAPAAAAAAGAAPSLAPRLLTISRSPSADPVAGSHTGVASAVAAPAPGSGRAGRGGGPSPPTSRRTTRPASAAGGGGRGRAVLARGVAAATASAALRRADVERDAPLRRLRELVRHRRRQPRARGRGGERRVRRLVEAIFCEEGVEAE